jgi:hypothetical protein
MEIGPDTHWIEGWVGPRAGLDAMEKRKILPLPGIEPGRPVRSQSLLSYHGIITPVKEFLIFNNFL